MIDSSRRAVSVAPGFFFSVMQVFRLRFLNSVSRTVSFRRVCSVYDMLACLSDMVSFGIMAFQEPHHMGVSGPVSIIVSSFLFFVERHCLPWFQKACTSRTLS